MAGGINRYEVTLVAGAYNSASAREQSTSFALEAGKWANANADSLKDSFSTVALSLGKDPGTRKIEVLCTEEAAQKLKAAMPVIKALRVS